MKYPSELSLTQLIDFLWGPMRQPWYSFRRLAKFLVAGFVAFHLHEATLELAGSTFDWNNITSRSTPINDLLRDAEFPAEVCFVTGNQPVAGVSSTCSAQSVTVPEEIVLGFYLVENGKPSTINEILVHNDSRLFFARSPAIVHSTQSVLRSIERIAFNPPEDRFSGVKLCAGTQKKLSSEECSTSAAIETILEDGVGAEIKNFRTSTLVFGHIQFLTLAVFLFITQEAIGRGLRWVVPGATLTKPNPAKPGAERFLDPGELKQAVDRYSSASVRSIPDRLSARALALSSETRGSEETHRDQAAKEVDDGAPVENREISRVAAAGGSTVEGYRDFLQNEADSRVESLHTANEVMLKLAFVGTIWGIGAALFSARSLDTADPVMKIVAKADMFGSIGTAFGTTLVGVVLSIFAAAIIQSLTSSWMQRINSSYQNTISLYSEIVSSGNLMTIDKGLIDLLVTPSPPPSAQKRNLFETLGILTTVVIVLTVLAIFALSESLQVRFLSVVGGG